MSGDNFSKGIALVSPIPFDPYTDYYLTQGAKKTSGSGCSFNTQGGTILSDRVLDELVFDDDCDGFCASNIDGGMHCFLFARGPHPKIEIIDFQDSSFQRLCSPATKMKTLPFVACCSNYFCYAFLRGQVISVVCLTARKREKKRRNTVTKMWERNISLKRLRALNMMEKDGDVLVLAAGWYEIGEKEDPTSLALECLSFKKEGDGWMKTFQELDPKTKLFDLGSITNDGMNFFVLNSKRRDVVVVSPSGAILGKVLTGLKGPKCISAHTSKKLAVQEENVISLYSIDY